MSIYVINEKSVLERHVIAGTFQEAMQIYERKMSERVVSIRHIVLVLTKES